MNFEVTINATDLYNSWQLHRTYDHSADDHDGCGPDDCADQIFAQLREETKNDQQD